MLAASLRIQGRVVTETDIWRSGSRSRSIRESVVLPAPEGDDRTSINPRRRISVNPLCGSAGTMALPLFDVLDLFAQLLNGDLEVEADARQFDIGRLGAEGIGLAIELLAKEIELAADGPAAFDQGPHGTHVGRQAIK